MRIFKTRAFQRWLFKQPLCDRDLVAAVSVIEQGLVGANLGGYLYKQRIALPGRGKRGSVRTLLAVKQKNKAFFLYGFEKNQRDTLSEKEVKAYKIIARTVLAYTDMELIQRMNDGGLIEIEHDQEN